VTRVHDQDRPPEAEDQLTQCHKLCQPTLTLAGQQVQCTVLVNPSPACRGTSYWDTLLADVDPTHLWFQRH
jgi:hypothetical protein